MTNRPPATAACPSCGARSSGKFCNQCGASLATAACGSCGSALAPGARFCGECGTAVGAGGSPMAGAVRTPASSASGVAMYLPWGLAAALLLALVGYTMGKSMSTADTPPPSADAGAAPFAPFANGASGPAPDISSMSPRERAGRLYDRIMRYVEQGKRDSAEFFAPMALSSFEMLGPDLDVDARYDYGRVAAETGNLPIAAAQSDTILKQAPSHLLGLALAARTASAQGNTKAAGDLWKRFLDARTAELAKNLPEYQAHAADIEQATKLAQGGK